MYQQAVAESEKQQKINAVEEIQHSTHARSIKEKFERGEIVTASDDEIDNKPKAEKPDEEVIAAGMLIFYNITKNFFIFNFDELISR